MGPMGSELGYGISVSVDMAERGQLLDEGTAENSTLTLNLGRVACMYPAYFPHDFH